MGTQTSTAEWGFLGEFFQPTRSDLASQEITHRLEEHEQIEKAERDLKMKLQEVPAIYTARPCCS